MGLDFSAVFSYNGPEANEQAILALERDALPAMKNVLAVLLEHGYDRDPDLVRVEWVDTFDVTKGRPKPRLPSTEVVLRISDFYLTFCRDAVWVCHTLRWRVFLTEDVWHAVMGDACDALGRHLGADEYVVVHDESPLVLAVLDGASYREAIDHVISKGEPEVEKLTDMYFEVDDRGTWDTKGFYRVRLDAE